MMLRERQGKVIWWTFLVLGAAGVAAHLFRQDWGIIIDNASFLARGLGTSILLTVIAVANGLMFGCLLAIARHAGPALIRLPATALIEVVRAVPALLVIFWMYFGAPRFVDVPIGPVVAGILSLSLVASAYMAEVIRGGLISIPESQIESGHATGLSKWHLYLYIIIPQAVRNMLPAIIATSIMMFKVTSLVYVIGINDFFRSAMLINNRVFQPEVIFTTVCLVYFTICFAFSTLIRRLDPKYQISS